MKKMIKNIALFPIAFLKKVIKETKQFKKLPKKEQDAITQNHIERLKREARREANRR